MPLRRSPVVAVGVLIVPLDFSRQERVLDGPHQRAAGVDEVVEVVAPHLPAAACCLRSSIATMPRSLKSFSSSHTACRPTELVIAGKIATATSHSCSSSSVGRRGRPPKVGMTAPGMRSAAPAPAPCAGPLFSQMRSAPASWYRRHRLMAPSKSPPSAPMKSHRAQMTKSGSIESRAATAALYLPRPPPSRCSGGPPPCRTFSGTPGPRCAGRPPRRVRSPPPRGRR